MTTMNDYSTFSKLERIIMCSIIGDSNCVFSICIDILFNHKRHLALLLIILLSLIKFGALRRAIQITSVSVVIWILLAFTLDNLGQTMSNENIKKINDDEVTVLVVAGGRVNRDCTLTDSFYRRVATSVELQKKISKSVILFTGGTSGSCPKTDAEGAHHIAVRLGANPNNLSLEMESHNTNQNAYYSSKILGQKTAIVVISDYYHLPRCQLLFQKYFHSVRTIGSRDDLQFRVVGAIREAAAIIHNSLIRWHYSPLDIVMLLINYTN
eukprot:NODE_6407_length_888_cov_45.955556_g5814_i0.p1 GENE.NODE_6407_length_888_cov_45.955556_g5814_i0~~NODE_6407_length_888_cov_45.955556_g5814_i0.p1  ORF type:complete len:286 (+),score=40.63 NODE_6407_length_888_cov_45.955556_g5814_i0:55-858(+)